MYTEYCIKFDDWYFLIENYEINFLNPETCLPNWLDQLAYYHGWGDVWDSSWEEEVKRELIKNSDYIWRNRGNREILPYLFEIFGLEATLVPQTGIILGVSTIPDFFLSDPFSYIIEYNRNYTNNSPQYKIIVRLVRDFLPCWCSFRLIGV